MWRMLFDPNIILDFVADELSSLDNEMSQLVGRTSGLATLDSVNEWTYSCPNITSDSCKISSLARTYDEVLHV